jgi:hypothetical protein
MMAVSTKGNGVMAMHMVKVLSIFQMVRFAMMECGLKTNPFLVDFYTVNIIHQQRNTKKIDIGLIYK